MVANLRKTLSDYDILRLRRSATAATSVNLATNIISATRAFMRRFCSDRYKQKLLESRGNVNYLD